MQRALALLALAVTASGCLVEVTHTRDPSDAFRDAQAEAARVQGQKGPARQLHVLAYDPKDRELVRVSVPLWMVRRLDGECDLDADHEHAREEVRRHVRLKDLEKAGLGVLVEVEKRGGERVLVWLS